MTFLRITKSNSITPNYLEGVYSNLDLTRLDETDKYKERSKYVDTPTDVQTEYTICYRAKFNCHNVGYWAAVPLKKLKLSNNNVVANIAAGLKDLENSEEIEKIHMYLIGIAIPRVFLNHYANIEDLMGHYLIDDDYEEVVGIRKKIDELCDNAIASVKSSSIGATLLAHKASRASKTKK